MTGGPAAEVERVRALVLAHGWNATAYQLVNPGIAHWFSADGDAVVGYVRRHGVRVVAGAPVCPEERLPAVAADFERAAHAAGDRVCYFGAEARLERLYRGDPSHAMVSLGAQPAWDPARWPEILRRRASLRAQLHRARNKEVCVAEWHPERAAGHPALRRCLAEWLGTRGLPPLHFLVEPETLDRLSDRRVFVAERRGRVVAFLVASPVPARSGWLVEQLVRGREAVNGTSEALIDAAWRALAADGARYVTLGLSPLSRRAVLPAGERPPRWLHLLLAWIRAHGRRFYNFDGLDRFKAKFAPEWWEPVYAIADTPSLGPRTLYAIAAAFTRHSPVLTVAGAAVRALGMELRRAGS
jgi:phosphatidylglycerol lysyltransferase